MKTFEKTFTQQESIPEDAISKAIEVLKSGRLHRYNTNPGEDSEAALLESEYAAYQGSQFCIAVASGGQALQIALRAVGLQPGDKILANAYTLAPVPGAIYAVGGVPVFVEIGDDWLTDIEDLRKKAVSSGAKFMMLSHMRGHISDMEAIGNICNELGIILIEDCAHTMGAKWKGEKSGNFGKVACFSTQTYKHINSGEGGIITTNDPKVAARSVILSGSYMLFDRHVASPPSSVYRDVKLETPNCSARLDNLRAAILRPQLIDLDMNIHRWNERYRVVEDVLKGSKNLKVVERPDYEEFVGSSFQFHILHPDAKEIHSFIERCVQRGVEIKWFGPEEPKAFTSRYDSWRYFSDIPHLPETLKVLSTTCDIRVPLTFTLGDCKTIAEIIVEESEVL